MNPQIAIPALPRATVRRLPRERSKGGCRACKEKKKGCNREKPTCERCAERGIECIYDPIQARRQPQPRPAPGGSSSDLAGSASRSGLGPFGDLERRSASETPSVLSSPESVTFETAPDPGPYFECFRDRLCPLLVFRDYSNPFVDEILPLKDKDQVLSNAICLLANAYQNRTLEAVETPVTELYSSVIQGLSRSIDQQTCYRDSKLAVNVLLCYNEMIQCSILAASNVKVHLRGALQIILPGISTKTAATRSLEKTLYFFDVLHSLEDGSEPMSTDLNLHRPPISLSRPLAYSDVDPIFGISMDLWPLLRRLAVVINLKQRLNSYNAERRPSPATSPEPTVQSYEVMQRDYEDRKREIWAQLRVWQPPAVSLNAGPAYYTSQLQSLVAHVEAYKAAAIIHLMREVYEIPTTSSQVQAQAKTVLESCTRILDANGPTTGLVWPMFVASLELVDHSNISDAQAAFSKLHSKRHANNVFSAWTVCQEVWRRRSMGIAESHWRQVAVDTGVAVVFG